MNILYEDNALVVLDKPAGLSSEEGVPTALRQHWDTPDAFVGVVHRLDTGVSGLMVFARTPAAAAALSRQITQSQEAYAVQDGRAEGRAEAPCFVKQYRAVLSGGPNDALPAAGTLRDWLFKDSRRGRVFPVSRPRKGVREAVLEYHIVRQTQDACLAEITLHTGRTHQIRVQFASRKHPLWGDGKYGSRVKGAIALQSCGLQFVHPDTGRIMNFTLPLPDTAPWNLYAEPGGTLQGTVLEAPDLRGGAALVIAALAAQGSSRVTHTEFIDRGYADFAQKLTALGGQIARETPRGADCPKKRTSKT